MGYGNREETVLDKDNFKEWYDGTTTMKKQAGAFDGGILKGDPKRDIPDTPIYWFDEVTQEKLRMTGYIFEKLENGKIRQHIDLLDHEPIERFLN